MSNENTETTPTETETTTEEVTATETEKPKATKRQVRDFATSEGEDAFGEFESLSRSEQTIFLAQAAELMRSQGSSLSKAIADDEDAVRIAQGDTVTIVSGDERFIGETGTVVNARRTRVFVEVEGAKSPVYLFRADVELVSTVAVEETEEDSNEDAVAEAV